MCNLIKALIFDLYGTLIHSEDKRVLKYIEKLLRKKTTNKSDIRRQLINIRKKMMINDLSCQDKLREIIVEFIEKENIENINNIVKKVLIEIQKEIDSTKLIDGYEEILKFFKRRNFKIGVVSNISSFHKEPYTKFRLSRYFDAEIFSCDIGLAKPDINIFLRACELLGVQ